jgi:hypothetical protein
LVVDVVSGAEALPEPVMPIPPSAAELAVTVESLPT